LLRIEQKRGSQAKYAGRAELKALALSHFALQLFHIGHA
jgi:hypothetical protein